MQNSAAQLLFENLTYSNVAKKFSTLKSLEYAAEEDLNNHIEMNSEIFIELGQQSIEISNQLAHIVAKKALNHKTIPPHTNFFYDIKTLSSMDKTDDSLLFFAQLQDNISEYLKTGDSFNSSILLFVAELQRKYIQVYYDEIQLHNSYEQQMIESALSNFNHESFAQSILHLLFQQLEKLLNQFDNCSSSQSIGKRRLNKSEDQIIINNFSQIIASYSFLILQPYQLQQNLDQINNLQVNVDEAVQWFLFVQMDEIKKQIERDQPKERNETQINIKLNQSQFSENYNSLSLNSFLLRFNQRLLIAMDDISLTLYLISESLFPSYQIFKQFKISEINVPNEIERENRKDEENQQQNHDNELNINTQDQYILSSHITQGCKLAQQRMNQLNKFIKQQNQIHSINNHFSLNFKEDIEQRVNFLLFHWLESIGRLFAQTIEIEIENIV